MLPKINVLSKNALYTFHLFHSWLKGLGNSLLVEYEQKKLSIQKISRSNTDNSYLENTICI